MAPDQIVRGKGNLRATSATTPSTTSLGAPRGPRTTPCATARSLDGGRRVGVDDQFLGMAYGLLDVVEFLHLAGLENVDDDWVRQSGLIEWS